MIRKNTLLEQVVLVDDNNLAIGTTDKDAIHHKNTPLHRAFSLFLFNEVGEILLQQRSRTKKTWPLMWSNSCCGHPLPGEDTEVAIRRRTAFELGITDIKKLRLALPDFRYRAERDGVVENEICPVWIGHTSQHVKKNPEEVEAYAWKAWADFIQDLYDEPEDYSEWCRLEAQKLVKVLDKVFSK